MNGFTRLRAAAAAQDGMGLVMVLVIGAALFAMGTTAAMLFASANNNSQRHVSYEQAIHLAEDGVDKVISKIEANGIDWVGNSTSSSTQPGGVAGLTFAPMPVTADTPKEEEKWARQQLEAVSASTLDQCGECRTAQGQVLAFRPAVSAGMVSRKVIYAMSWVPSRAKPKFSRFLKTEFLKGVWSPTAGVLTGKTLEFAGNSSVTGTAANVHSNGTIDPTGNAFNVLGTMTASGSFLQAPKPGTVQGGWSAGAPTLSINGTDPSYYRANVRPADGAGWWDLCAATKTVEKADSALPCEGTVVPGDATKNPGVLGWQVDNSGTWKYSSNTNQNGVFYAHEGSIDISGSPGSVADPWQVSLLASAKQTGTQANGCPILDKGDIKITGSGKFKTKQDPIAMIAGRDLIFSGGGTTASLSGFIAANEQFDAQGNTTSVNGAIISQDKCDSPSSPVHTNKISGNFQINYNNDVVLEVANLIRTSLWLEL